MSLIKHYHSIKRRIVQMLYGLRDKAVLKSQRLDFGAVFMQH